MPKGSRRVFSLPNLQLIKWITKKRLLLTLLLIAATLRPPVTSIPPQVDSIRKSLGLSLTAFGFLTSIPVICFGIAAPISISLYFRRRSTDTIIGALNLTTIISATSTMQISVESSLRGRVMGLYLLVFMGGTTFGAPLMGWFAEATNPRYSIAAGGAITALFVCGVLVMRRLHPPAQNEL